MSNIDFQVYSKSDLPIELSTFFRNEFKESASDIEDRIKGFIDNIIDGACYLVEFPYVDKVYRDSFYKYFSSKLNTYSRDCIRVSIFKKSIEINEFFNKSNHAKLKENYAGFFIIRPTLPNPIGRSIITRDIVKLNGSLICESSFSTTCMGLKFSVSGFPYSSQDVETITCAETTLWSLMEYFSNNYVDYTPVLPSNIISTLESISIERQLPSKGLNIEDLSFALKSYGFGTRIYSESDFGSDFNKLISSYVESGIPLLIAMSNGKNIHHALICCGREEVSNLHIQNLKLDDGYYDFGDIGVEYIFVDDNLFPFKRAGLDSPGKNYSTPEWKQCKITHFIVPLYPKVYLEVYEAKNYFKRILKNSGIKNVTLRVFLTSSRSFKNEILENDDLTDEYKREVISLNMPKFIWVCEISNKTLIKKKKCFGTVVLDATEPNINKFKPIIFFQYYNSFLFKEDGSLSLKDLKEPISNYAVYQNNLDGF